MKIRDLSILAALLLTLAVAWANQGNVETQTADEGSAAPGRMETATLAGGCFWCMEPPFEKLDGVSDVVSGYTGGTGTNPTYEDYGRKGHIEAIKVYFDPEQVSYAQLLQVFWRQIDPTDAGGQFVDRGPYYRSAVFYQHAEQKRVAEESKAALAASGRFSQPIVTEILPAGAFYRAEDYHQDYYRNHSLRYRFYRSASGRDSFLDRAWGADRDLKLEPPAPEFTKPSDEEIRKMLTQVQYEVTQQDGTEPAFANEYWDNHREGIYVDVVSGEPLFSSLDKYESGTGWPSFTRPLEPANIVTKTDRSCLMTSTEVRSRHGDSHLGHVFEDGPAPTGLRYCMNSAALRFIPREKLVEQGYGRYQKLFETK